MAYDEQLAERVRAALPDRDNVTERKMFGGVAWMISGNMACGIMGDGLLARLGPEGSDAALDEPHTSAPEMMPGRTMKGYVLVDPDGIADDESLQRWVDQTIEFAESLPPK